MFLPKDSDKYQITNYCLKVYGVILLSGPLLFFLLSSRSENLKMGDKIDFYTLSLVQGAIASIPFLVIYILAAYFLNSKVKDKNVFKGTLSFLGLFLILLMYQLPIRFFYEGIILVDDMKVMYGIAAVIAPFIFKMKNKAKEEAE